MRTGLKWTTLYRKSEIDRSIAHASNACRTRVCSDDVFVVNGVDDVHDKCLGATGVRLRLDTSEGP